jgi:hypothetical protein
MKVRKKNKTQEINKFICKVRKWQHRNPYLVISGMRFQKTREKVHSASMGHETQFSSKFGAKLSLPYPFLSWTLSMSSCCRCVCYSYKCSQEPGAFSPESQYFIPLFKKISWFCGQQPGKDEASNEGCNSGFTNNSNVYEQFSTMIKII